MRNYYLFRYSVDVYKPFVEEFKCMTYDEMLDYYDDLSSRFASLAVYELCTPRNNFFFSLPTLH